MLPKRFEDGGEVERAGVGEECSSGFQPLCGFLAEGVPDGEVALRIGRVGEDDIDAVWLDGEFAVWLDGEFVDRGVVNVDVADAAAPRRGIYVG
jgi:hypothetical protein